jgi:23S rRNA pseudouridine955/2504/2580 synthase
VRVNKGRKKADYKLQIDDVVRIPPIRVAESKPSKTINKTPEVARSMRCTNSTGVLNISLSASITPTSINFDSIDASL